MMPKGTLIDIKIAIKEVKDAAVVTNNQGTSFDKLDVIIYDNTKDSFTLVLWDLKSKENKYPINSIWSIRGAKVGEYGDKKYIQCVTTSTISQDLTSELSLRLQSWIAENVK
ncbi:uncharacterized protein LOC116415861 [Nasonia vitripennis]|uniref:Replication protein A OB domain-containing protein n=1 Tax=Nasonia vitripennis TaxID=7425 RepID=A0A7M7PUS1_NASVI|nr:uncharacterized protein LOC116415861 [Nasonia vitripennis]